MTNGENILWLVQFIANAPEPDMHFVKVIYSIAQAQTLLGCELQDAIVATSIELQRMQASGFNFVGDVDPRKVN